MADRPMIFSAPMVHALLAGRKTQTRRLLKPVKGLTLGNVIDANKPGKAGWQHITREQVAAPKFAPVDTIWVREAMRWTDNLVYDADQTPIPFDRMPADFTAGRGFVTGMFMPRWASRITLTITDVRVEQLQEITEADAVAEGAMFHNGGEIGHSGWRHDFADVFATARGSYNSLWTAIHGPGAWDANPWVVALTFAVSP